MVEENFNEKVKSESRCEEGVERRGQESCGWRGWWGGRAQGPCLPSASTLSEVEATELWAERDGAWAFAQGGLVLCTFTRLLIWGHERTSQEAPSYYGRILRFTSVARDGFLEGDFTLGKLNSFEVLAPLARLFPRKCFLFCFRLMSTSSHSVVALLPSRRMFAFYLFFLTLLI